jgi:hypothetical protein
MMFHWLVDEQRSARSIAVELRRLGIRPQCGEQWAKSSVRNVLTIRFYIGEGFFNQREVVANPGTGRKTRHRLRPATEWIPLATPAIVTPELFARAQQQLPATAPCSPAAPAGGCFCCAGSCGVGRAAVGSWASTPTADRCIAAAAAIACSNQMAAGAARQR